MPAIRPIAIRWIVCAAAAACLTLLPLQNAAGQLLDGLRADSLRLSAEELSWIDPHLSDAERALLDTTRGAAPPAFDASARFVGTDPIRWAEFRGRVVVVQSWSSATSEGRPIPRRVQRILEEFDPNDVVAVFVHTPDGADGAGEFLQRMNFARPVVIDPLGMFLDEMGMFRRPVLSIIDRGGRVRYAGVSMTSLEAALRKLVAERYDPEADPPRPMVPRDDRVIAVAGQDASAAPAQASYPPVRRDDRMPGEDLRGKPFGLIGPEHAGSLTAVRPLGNMAGRVGIFVLFTHRNLSDEQLNILNRYAMRQGEHVTVVGIMHNSPDRVAAWANSNNVQFGLLADPDNKIADAVRIQPNNLPFVYVTSPDAIVRWQGGIRSLSSSMVNQIISASGIDRDAARPTDPAPRLVDLPRWRSIVRR